jgi:serine/threonine protein phosphatase PrpC
MGKSGESAAAGAQNKAEELTGKAKPVSLPNGRVNQDYEVPFDVESLLPGVAEYVFVGLSETGLRYDSENKRIVGKLLAPGSHTFTVHCLRRCWTDGQPVLKREFSIIVNPDPRSLWNQIETPLDCEFYKPDSNCARADTAAMLAAAGKAGVECKTMLAASQRGRSHAHEGKPRDDDFALHFDPETEWYILTVADGAGSAKYSRRGSEIACATVVDVCRAKIGEHGKELERFIAEYRESNDALKPVGDALYNILGTAVFRAYKEIESEAKTMNLPVKNFATTLIVSVCRRFDFGWFIGAFWVGDGGIGVYRRDPPYLKILGEPDGGEFAGQTRFLTMPEIFSPDGFYKRLRFDLMQDFTALVMMTDGVTDAKFETDANLLDIEHWRALMDDLAGANEEGTVVDFAKEDADLKLLKWLDFWSKGNHDDRTIAILS